ncbi:MAG: hypothetical protein GY701_33275, partial [Sulfitobacter sp.]|nr:hypothetical protein [Sulfitobacter sp.]
CCLFATDVMASAPAPNATISMETAATSTIGSQAWFSVDITNGGTDTGFSPYYRLILPPDLTLTSASLFGQSLSTYALGVFPASPGNQIIDNRADNASVTGTEGYSLTNLLLPLYSLSQGGPTITTDICVDVSTSAVFATPLDVSLQPVFQYGDTATGDNGAIAGTA